MEEEKRDYSEENRKRMLVALAILLGADVDNDAESYSNIPKDILKRAKKIYEEKALSPVVEQEARMPEREIQIRVAETGNQAQIKIYKIFGTKDDRTCEDCAKWQGTTVTMQPDGVHRTVADFINDHGFHPNCRCSLQPENVKEIPLNPLNPRYDERMAANPTAYNSCLNGKRLVFG